MIRPVRADPLSDQCVVAYRRGNDPVVDQGTAGRSHVLRNIPLDRLRLS